MIETLVRRVLESLLLSTESNTVSKRFINMYASVRIVLDPLLQGLVTVWKQFIHMYGDLLLFLTGFFPYIYRAPVSRADNQGTQPQQTTSGSATHAHTWSAVLFDWSHTTQNPRQLADLRT